MTVGSLQSVEGFDQHLHLISQANSNHLDEVSIKITKIIITLSHLAIGPEENENTSKGCCSFITQNKTKIFVVIFAVCMMVSSGATVVISLVTALARNPDTGCQSLWGIWTVFAITALASIAGVITSIGLLILNCIDKEVSKKKTKALTNTRALMKEATKLILLINEMKTLSTKTDISEKEQILSNCASHYQDLSKLFNLRWQKKAFTEI